VWLNRSKESLTLDLKQDGAKEVLNRLIERADVFVQNLSPGAAGRLGFGAGELRERDPRLIVCDVSGYGSSGPYRDKKAYDLLVQCEAGLVSITGTPDAPSKVGIAVADIAAGMYAYSGILAALLRRERTGEGAAIEVPLFEALAEWMGFPAYYAMYGGTEPPRIGASHAAIAPYGPFECADGEVVFFGIQNEREWERFCEAVLEQPALAGDERFTSNSERVENVDALHAAIEDILKQLSSEEALEPLDGAKIANARMRTVQDFLEHPQLEARDRWREVESPVGPLRATSGDGMRGYRNSLRIDTIVAPQSLRIAFPYGFLTVEATTIMATSRYPFDHTGTAEMPCDDWGSASHSNLGSDALLFPYCKADMGDRCLTCGCIVHLPEGGSGKSRA
jgi:itaconate CoA-transferase